MAPNFIFSVRYGNEFIRLEEHHCELLILGEKFNWDLDVLKKLGITNPQGQKEVLERKLGGNAPFERRDKPLHTFLVTLKGREAISPDLLFTYFIGKRCRWDPDRMKKYGADLNYYRNILESYGMLPDWLAHKITSTRIMRGKARIEEEKRIKAEERKRARELEEIKNQEIRKIQAEEKKEKPGMNFLTSEGENDMTKVQSDLILIIQNEGLPRLARAEARIALTELINAHHKEEPMKRAVEIIRRVKATGK